MLFWLLGNSQLYIYRRSYHSFLLYFSIFRAWFANFFSETHDVIIRHQDDRTRSSSSTDVEEEEVDEEDEDEQ